MDTNKPYVEVLAWGALVKNGVILANSEYELLKEFKHKKPNWDKLLIKSLGRYTRDQFLSMIFEKFSSHTRMMAKVIIRLEIPVEDVIDEVILLSWNIWSGIDDKYKWMDLNEVNELLKNYK